MELLEMLSTWANDRLWHINTYSKIYNELFVKGMQAIQ